MPPIQAVAVRRFQLAIIDEASGQPVIRICKVPEHLVESLAGTLEAALPVIQAAAAGKAAIQNLAASVGSAAPELWPRPPGRPANGGRKQRRR